MSQADKGGTEVDVSAVVPANTHSYFVERDGAAFRALLAKSLGLSACRFRGSWTDDTTGSVYVRLVTKPEVASWVPSAMANQISEIEFHDIIEYAPAATCGPSYCLSVRTESPFLGDKLDVRMTLTLEPLGDGQTLQRLRGRVRVRMFGLGSVIERSVRDNLKETYAKLPDIVARWEAFRAEVMASGNAGLLLAGRPLVGGDVEYVRALMQAPVPRGIGRSNSEKGEQKVSRRKLSIEKEDAAFFDAAEQLAAAGDSGEIEAAAAAAVEHVLHMDVAEVDRLRLTSMGEDAGAAAPPAPRLPAPAPEQLPSKPTHERRRTADALILDALPPLAPEEPPPGGPKLAKWHHLQRLSADAGEKASEAAAGARVTWTNFNRQYTDWEVYWGEVGVAARAAEEGTVRALVLLLQALGDFLRVLALMILLLLVRSGLVRVTPSRLGVPGARRHRRTASAPPEALVLDGTTSLTPTWHSHAHHLSIPYERKANSGGGGIPQRRSRLALSSSSGDEGPGPARQLSALIETRDSAAVSSGSGRLESVAAASPPPPPAAQPTAGEAKAEAGTASKQNSLETDEYLMSAF